MEMDEFKAIWQQMERRLEREEAMSFAMLRQQTVEGARRSLRPLATGQRLQIFWGLLFVLLATLLWSTRPSAVPVIVAGVLVQLYGIGCLVVAGMVLGGLARIDYADPVLDVQSRLATVRRAYVLSGVVAGFSWWFLWIPLVMVLFGLLHVNLYAHAPSLVWGGVGIGVAGLCGMWWIFHRSRRSPDSRLRRLVDEAVFSKSLLRAQAQLEEVRRFELETP